MLRQGGAGAAGFGIPSSRVIPCGATTNEWNQLSSRGARMGYLGLGYPRTRLGRRISIAAYCLCLGLSAFTLAAIAWAMMAN
jgi:hypothetical protein